MSDVIAALSKVTWPGALLGVGIAAAFAYVVGTWIKCIFGGPDHD